MEQIRFFEKYDLTRPLTDHHFSENIHIKQQFFLNKPKQEVRYEDRATPSETKTQRYFGHGNFISFPGNRPGFSDLRYLSLRDLCNQQASVRSMDGNLDLDRHVHRKIPGAQGSRNSLLCQNKNGKPRSVAGIFPSAPEALIKAIP